MQPVHRFLSLVIRDLDAQDARLELGGTPDPGAIWAPLNDDFRVVAIFASPPADPDAKREALAALASSFSGVVATVALPHGNHDREPIARTLEDTLDLLAHRARAESAWVIDESSPEIWGSSEPGRPALDVNDAVFLTKLEASVAALGLTIEHGAIDAATVRARAEEKGLSADAASAIARDVERLADLPHGALEPRALRSMRALARVRESGSEDGTFLVRPLATIYRLVLVFAGPISELHTESALIRAMPVVERLVTSLPPRRPEGSGPESAGAKVAVLRRLRPV